MPLKHISIGTYQIHEDLYPILSEAWKRKNFFVDTAPNYRGGNAHAELNDALRKAQKERIIKDLRDVKISTKVGFIPNSEKDSLLAQGIIEEKDTYHSHNISERYIHYQLAKTVEIFKDGKLEILFLHNPEAQFHIKSKEEVLYSIRKGFEYLESLAEKNKIEGYGISTWTGFEGKIASKGFSLKELFSIAKNIAGENHHFKAIQLPISMIKIEALRLALKEKRGPLQEAAELNISVHASSPLHGGQLPKLISNEIISLLDKNLTPAQAALLFACSHPAISRILTSPSSLQQLEESLSIERVPDLDVEKLLYLLDLLN